jgi:hypothetical protein
MESLSSTPLRLHDLSAFDGQDVHKWLETERQERDREEERRRREKQQEEKRQVNRLKEVRRATSTSGDDWFCPEFTH